MKKLLALLLVGAAFLTTSAQAADDSIVLPTVEGKKIHVKGTENGLDFKEYRGRVVFLEFWGTHCPPCLISVPNYIKLKKMFKDKLAIVAIEVQDTPADKLKKFAEAKGINYDVVPYRDAYSFVNYVGKRAGWKGSIPFLIILDKSGNVVTMQVGLLNEKALEGIVEKLSEMPATPAKKAETNSSKPAEK